MVDFTSTDSDGRLLEVARASRPLWRERPAPAKEEIQRLIVV
jgi:hypothetical protein